MFRRLNLLHKLHELFFFIYVTGCMYQREQVLAFYPLENSYDYYFQKKILTWVELITYAC